MHSTSDRFRYEGSVAMSTKSIPVQSCSILIAPRRYVAIMLCHRNTKPVKPKLLGWE